MYGAFGLPMMSFVPWFSMYTRKTWSSVPTFEVKEGTAITFWRE